MISTLRRQRVTWRKPQLWKGSSCSDTRDDFQNIYTKSTNRYSSRRLLRTPGQELLYCLDTATIFLIVQILYYNTLIL